MTLVLVVDDSKFMRTVLRNTLQDYGYSVIEASNGHEAVAAVKQYDPDVVTMDVRMPEMDGLEAVEIIMDEHPVPVLMLSAVTNEGADTTLQAIQSGAVDFIPKPDGKETPITAVNFGDDLIDPVEAVANADVGQDDRLVPDGARAKSRGDSPDGVRTPSVGEEADETPPTIVIGASTGGPSLVEEIMKDLPHELNAYVFIVQHMPEGFTKRFADRLDKASPYEVTEASDGMRVTPGDAVVAKGSTDMIVNRRGDEVVVELDEGSQNGTSSISATLSSAAEQMDAPLVAALLTGMGNDGADALDGFKQAGGYIVAQDEETSPVFGIPRRAIQTGNVDDVLGDYDIVNGIVTGVEESAPKNGDSS